MIDLPTYLPPGRAECSSGKPSYLSSPKYQYEGVEDAPQAQDEDIQNIRKNFRSTRATEKKKAKDKRSPQ